MNRLTNNTNQLPELIFMYGFTASGKTTFSKNFVKYHPEKNYVYLSADETRRELYGSQDAFGDPEEIYKILLQQMMTLLKMGRNVVYDACNLYRQFRMDYLDPIKNAGIKCYKVCIRMNTTKETCLTNHANRGRNFDINDIAHYFDINEPPQMSEGWDWICDMPDHAKPHTRIYIAASSENTQQQKDARDIAEHFRRLGHSIFLPNEHESPNTYDLPKSDAAKAVYALNCQEIQNTETVIYLDYGRATNPDASWKAGYAAGINKTVLTVKMTDTQVMTGMAVNASHTVFENTDQLYKYNLAGIK